MKIAEEKFNSVNKDEWTARYKHAKKVAEGCLKLELAIGEKSERFIINRTDSDNSCSDISRPATEK
jgi:hypothetical protein